MSRPTKPASQRRAHQMQIRLTTHEKRVVNRLAKLLGTTPSGALRMCALEVARARGIDG
jgi:hypothetical protein